MAKRAFAIVAVFAAMLSVTLSVQADPVPLDYYWVGGVAGPDANPSESTKYLYFTTKNWNVGSQDGTQATIKMSNTSYAITCYILNDALSGDGQHHTVAYDYSTLGAAVVTLNIGHGQENNTDTATVSRSSNLIIENGKTLNVLKGGTFKHTGGLITIKNGGTFYVNGGSYSSDDIINLKLEDGGYLSITASNALKIASSHALTIEGGTAIINNKVYVGTSSAGSIVQSNGTATFNDALVLGWGSGKGTYNLSGGTLTTTNIAGLWSIRNAATSTPNEFNVTGGTANFNQQGNSFVIGLDTDGTNNNYGTASNNPNVFNLNSGTVNATDTFAIQYGGTLNLAKNGEAGGDGVLNANKIDINNSGNLNMSSGTINLGSGGITNTSGAYTITLSGGTFGTNNASWTTSLAATISSNAVTFAPEAGQMITWSGALDGDGGIIKTGAGDLKIAAGSSGNSYAGGTTVSAGTLYLSGTNQGKSSVGTGDVTINNGAAIVAQSHNVFGSGDGSNIPKVIINGGSLTPNQYLHMKALDINGGNVNSHGSSGDGLDFSDRNGTITSTGASSIASKITNRSTLTINVAENGTLSLTNNIDNIQNSSNTTIKTGTGTLTTSGWINANVEVQQGTLQITGQYNNNGKRFNGEVTIDQGAKLECATHDSLGYGTAATKMNTYGLMDNTVGNETFDYIELHMYGGTAQSSSGGSFDILSSNVKFYSHPENESQTTTTESTISSKLVLRHNGTLEIDTKANSQLNLAGEITGLYSSTHYTCSINKLGDGTLVLSSRNPSLYGGTTISAGKVIANAAQSGSNAGKSVFGSGAVEVASGATLDFQVVNQLGYETPNDITIKGTLIPHNFTHVKNVTLQNGVIETENDKTSNGTGLDFDTRTATLASSGTSRIDSRINVNKYSDHLTFNVTDTLTVNGVIREATGNNAGGGFIKTGAGTLELTADNAYTGTTTISAGTIKLSGNGDLGSGNVVNNATLDFAHTADFTGDNAFANVISGTGVVNKTGTGTLTLSGANTYTGMTNVNAGVLELTGDAVVANGPVSVGANGTLEYNLASGQTKKLSISEINKIVSTGKVIKTGDGTLQLYSEAQGLIGINSLTVSSGQVDLKGYMTGGITVDAGGVFSPGNSVGEATFGGGYILKEGATLLIEQDATGIDKLNVGSFTFQEDSISKNIELDITGIPFGSKYDIITSSTDFTGDLLTDEYWLKHFKDELPDYMTLAVVNNNTVRLYIDRNAVPEPSTWALLILGAAGLLYWRKRKNA